MPENARKFQASEVKLSVNQGRIFRTQKKGNMAVARKP